MRIKQLLTSCFLMIGIVAFSQQFDGGVIPTDNLDISEIQANIDRSLPEKAGNLRFSRIAVLPFSGWPDGLVKQGHDANGVFQGYSLKTFNNSIYFMDQAGYSVFKIRPQTGKYEIFSTDYGQKNIKMEDFGLLSGNSIVLSDNSRQSLLFFENNRLKEVKSLENDRVLFRHIDFVESDVLGRKIAVYDSGRNRTVLLDSHGKSLWNREGKMEPCFYGASVLNLEKADKGIAVNIISELSRTPRLLDKYYCKEGNIVLDAWIAGTFRGTLVMVVYEGKGDEDHPDYAKVVLFKDGKQRVVEFKPFMDFRLGLVTPFRLLLSRNGLKLITARLLESGIEIIGSELPIF